MKYVIIVSLVIVFVLNLCLCCSNSCDLSGANYSETYYKVTLHNGNELIDKVKLVDHVAYPYYFVSIETNNGIIKIERTMIKRYEEVTYEPNKVYTGSG